VNRLKKKWKIEGNLRFVLTLAVFSLAGSSIIFVRKPIFFALGITSDTPSWIKVVSYVLVAVPLYQILLLAWAAIFGQFRFFGEFEKKMISRFKRRRE